MATKLDYMARHYCDAHGWQYSNNGLYQAKETVYEDLLPIRNASKAMIKAGETAGAKPGTAAIIWQAMFDTAIPKP